MSGREERRRRRRRRDARAYSTYDALVHTQFKKKEGRQREREKSTSKAKDEGQRRAHTYSITHFFS
jgi:hypothetical protein